jgi:hypothetical protein
VADKFITVATYSLAYEAELARNLLAAEGIAALVGGDMAGSLLPTFEIQLQVAAGDAQKAAALLAAAESATLDEDWESKAESGVWTCSLCGEAVPEGETACRSCQTPRDAIRATRPASQIRREPPPPEERVQDDIPDADEP